MLTRLTNDEDEDEDVDDGVWQRFDDTLARDVEPRTARALARRRREDEAQEEDVGTRVSEELHVRSLHHAPDLLEGVRGLNGG